MKTAFGLDIAGYSTGKSGFARADQKDNHIVVTVYEGHVFVKKHESTNPLHDIAEMEKEMLIACYKKGPLLVDIPIDLQGLPCPRDVFFTWELVKRPVDFAFNAMPPLADCIGSPLARYLHLFSSLNEEFETPLGKKIFETYPAGSLNLLNLTSKGYKGQQTSFKNGHWNGGQLAKIFNELRLTSNNGESFNDDNFDAMICAVTGVVDKNYRLQGDELNEKISYCIEKRLKSSIRIRIKAPDGYVLLKKIPEMEIKIVKKEVNTQQEMLQEVAK